MENTQKIYAKLNLNLYIDGVDGAGYHNISSYVTTIDICDTITVKRREDKEITVTTLGYGLDIPKEQNNAYKACKAYMEKYGGFGYDITIDKQIPIGGGLGGSSADICGVIKCLVQLNGSDEEGAMDLLRGLGSDTVYMYKGGFAHITGRGNDVKFMQSNAKMHFILAVPDFSVSSKEAFELYDNLKPTNAFAEYFYNALERGVAEKYPILKEIRTKLKNSTEFGVSMTGSGSVIFAVYPDEISRNTAFESLIKDFKGLNVKLLKANSI